MRIHVLTHVPFEGPAAIADWANARGNTLTITPLYNTITLPELTSFDWLIIMGGPMGAQDDAIYSWLTAEKNLIAAAIAANKTVIGICLGAQLIASVLRARVFRNPEREIGWFPLELTAAGHDSKLFNALSPNQSVLHWHGDTFELPIGAIQLARSAACEQQIFQYGQHVIGLQCHLEATSESVIALVTHCADELQPAHFVQSEAQLFATTAEDYTQLKTVLFALLDQLAAI